MEAFEQFVAVAMEMEGLVVSPAVKFPVRKKTNKESHDEFQTHGYEVDLVGARADRLVLASVKSFLGSRGVQAKQVAESGLYRLLNDMEVREGVVAEAARRYGYQPERIQLRLYVGKFAGKNGADETAIRAWCARQAVGAGAIEVYGLQTLIDKVRQVAASRTYVNNPVVVAVKALAAAGLVNLQSEVGVPDVSKVEDDEDDEPEETDEER